MSREIYYILSSWLALVSLLSGLMVLAFQVRAYRITRHRSLRLLIASSALLIVCVPVSVALQFYFWRSFATSLYWLLAVLTTIEAAIAVLGVRSLLQAFSQSFAADHPSGGA